MRRAAGMLDDALAITQCGGGRPPATTMWPSLGAANLVGASLRVWLISYREIIVG